MILQFNKKQLIIIQVIFWLVVGMISFFPIEFHGPNFHPPVDGGHFHPHRGGPHVHQLGDELLFVVQNLSIVTIFYLNYFKLIPRFYVQGKIKKYFFIALILILIVAGMPLFFEFLGHRFHFHLNPRNFHQAVISLLAVCLAILVPLAFRISKDHADSDREKTKAELSFLRSQINHHFLFNSLNNIYALSLQGNQKTSQAIYSLSSMMRHMATTSASSKIPLQQEIDFIHHYIEIQKLRLSSNTELNYIIDGATEGKQIGPMLLIPFVENCFKHGVSTSQPSNIDIQIHVFDNYLELQTKNNIIQHINNTDIQSGVGLNNVKRRLNYEYYGHYIMTQETKDNYYTSYLKIDLI